MPLVQRSVKNNHSYGAKFFETQHARYRLEDTQMGGCVGSLERLGLLSDYAADIFKDLIESTSKIHKRIVVATKRTHDLVEHLPEATSFVDGSRSFLGRLDQRPAEGSREQFPETCLLDHSSMPNILQRRYESEDVYHMPDIKALDGMVDPDSLQPYGGSLCNRYSNPNFVRDEWIKKKEEENMLLEAAKEAKKQEKRAKRAKKVEIGGGAHNVEKKKALNWKDGLKASGDTGPLQQGIVRRSSVTNVQSNYPVVEKTEDGGSKATPAPAVSSAPPATVLTHLPKVSVTGLFGAVGAPEQKQPPPPVPTEPAPPPVPVERAPPPVPTVAGPPPIPVAPVPPVPSAPAPEAEPAAKPEPTPPAVVAPPPPVVAPSEPQDDGPPAAPPPPAPKLFRPPPPPPPRAVPPPPAPVAVAAPGAPPAPPPPPPPRAPIGQNGGGIDLLTAIRRGSVLKKVDPPVKSDKKKTSVGAFGGTAVESILARRKALQQDDESSSDEDDEDDW